MHVTLASSPFSTGYKHTRTDLVGKPFSFHKVQSFIMNKAIPSGTLEWSLPVIDGLKSLTWSYFVTYCRPLFRCTRVMTLADYFTARSHVLSVLKTGVVHGRLQITDQSGIYTLGNLDDESNTVCITVTDDNFWVRVMLSVDL